jgi:hypothetical protein
VIQELRLEPSETSIVRPGIAEVTAAIEDLEAPEVRRVERHRYEVHEADGSHTEVELQGGPEAIERVVVRRAGGFDGAPHARLFCVDLAEALQWRVQEPGSGRQVTTELLLDSERRLGRPRVRGLRLRLLVIVALVVFPAAVMWHLGGRQRDAWFWILAAGIGLYFALRAWGFLVPRLGRR